MTRLIIILTLLSACASAFGGAPGFDEVDRLIRLRHYEEAVARLESMVADGDSDAAYRLGSLYRAGRGVPRDFDRARDLFLQSARAGNADAQYALGVLIEKADPSAKAEARRWISRAAAQHHQRAVEKLGSLGKPGPDDIKVGPAEIFTAIQHNDEAMILSLQEQGIDLDYTDEHGNSTVMVALLSGWTRLAQILIRHSRLLNQTNRLGDAPIHVAARSGYIEATDELLERGVDVDLKDSRGNTALMLAVQRDNELIALSLIEQGADYNLRNQKNQTAADIAFADENSASRALFVALGIEPQARPVATARRDLGQFREAVKRQADRYRNWPLVNVAIELGETEIAQQLIAQKSEWEAADPAGNRALHVAARKSDLASLRQLLDRGAHVNAVNRRNESALFLAVEADSLEAVRLLLARGADPAIAARPEITALEIAVRDNRSRIAQALLAKDVDYPGIHRVLLMAIDRKMEHLSLLLIKRDRRLGELDAKDRSVLWHCADVGLESTAARLLEMGKVDVNRRDVNGYSPLAQAVRQGHFGLVRRFADAGADLGTQTAERNSLLLLAVLSKNREVVKFLIDRGVPLNAQNNVGDTALMLAAASGQNRLVEMLIHAGADMQLRNNEDLNAYQIAEHNGHTEIARLIYEKSNLVFKIFN